MTAPARSLAPPHNTHLRVAVMPVLNLLNSLSLLNFTEALGGLAPWVYATAPNLSPDQQQDNRLIMGVLLDALIQDSNLNLSFPDFLAELRACSPEALHERVVLRLAQNLGLPAAELLADGERFVAAAAMKQGQPALDETELRRAYAILIQPARMQALLLAQLQHAWDRWLEPEWTCVEASLRESAEAFNRLGLAGLSLESAFQWVTGRASIEELALSRPPDEVIFVPSAHSGPYITVYDRGDRVYVCFGARMPAGQPDGAGRLTRSQLLNWVGALADETRLSILAMIASEGEVCAQEIINRFELSQSSASRHLRQLRAAGFLRERRRDGANKCYTLNPGRMDELIHGLRALLQPD